MKKSRILIVSLLILAAGFAGPLSVSADAAGELDGRTVAENGKRGSVTGILVYESSEWYLKSGDTLYELHLGRIGHDSVTTSTMKEGNSAEVAGFILDKNISPISIVSDGRDYQFRSETGAPLWAGQGDRRNAAASVSASASASANASSGKGLRTGPVRN